MIFVSLLATCVLHAILFRGRPLISPISVFFLAYLYYCYFVPVTMEIFQQYDILIVAQPLWVNAPDMNLAAIAGFLGYAGYAITYRLTAPRLSAADDINDANSRSLVALLHAFAMPRLLLIFMILYGIIIAYFFPAELLSVMSGYQFKITTNYENATFSFLMGGLFVLASLIANYFIINGRLYYVYGMAAILFFVIGSFATFSKGPFIYALLCGLCLLHRYGRIPPFPVLAALTVLAVITLVYLIPAFSLYRAQGTVEFIDPRDLTLNMIYSDAAGPFGVMIYAFNGYVHVDGHPLWQSFLLWVPRMIWEGRPIDLSEDFARLIMVNWQPGYGLGFSPIGEGYARFGMFGVPFLMAALAASVAFFERIAARVAPSEARMAIVVTVGGYLSMIIMRNPFSAVFTQGLQLAVPIVVIGIVATYLQARQQAQPHRGTATYPQAVQMIRRGPRADRGGA